MRIYAHCMRNYAALMRPLHLYGRLCAIPRRWSFCKSLCIYAQLCDKFAFCKVLRAYAHHMCCYAQDTWSIGQYLHVPCFTPSNNPQERWHKSITENLKGQMRGSTAAVLSTTLPKLWAIDAVNMPDTLNFQACLCVVYVQLCASQKMRIRAHICAYMHRLTSYHA